MSTPGLSYRTPGVRAAQETVEAVVQWGDPLVTNHYKTQALIDGSSRDLGHTGQTTHLRPGLLMGYHVANEKWIPYDSTAAAAEGGTLLGILYESIPMQVGGVDSDRLRGSIIWGGPVLAKSLLVNEGTPGPMVGHATEAAVRTALNALGFKLDDWFQQ